MELQHILNEDRNYGKPISVSVVAKYKDPKTDEIIIMDRCGGCYKRKDNTGQVIGGHKDNCPYK